MKKLIRKFAVWLRTTTDAWVVPKSAYILLSGDRFDECEALLTQAELDWPQDPEVAYFWTLLQFSRGDE